MMNSEENSDACEDERPGINASESSASVSLASYLPFFEHANLKKNLHAAPEAALATTEERINSLRSRSRCEL